MSHIKKIKTGLSWSFFTQFSQQGLGIIVSIILARLIAPAEFGVVGMVSVFVNFAALFVDFGFSTVLIQKDVVTFKDQDTAFFCNVVIALILYISFYLLAPFIAAFYNEPRLNLVTKVAALSFLITPIASVKPALVAKSMDFKTVAKVSLSSVFGGSLLAIVMAIFGFGVWAIVSQMLATALISAVYYQLISDYTPSFRFNKASFKEMFSMGSNIVGDHLVNYWTRNADNLMVGKMLGDAPLGIYSRAYALMLMPLTNITRVISRVMLPSFSEIKKDKSEVKRIYLRTIQVIAALTFPMMFGLSAVSDAFVLTLFGPNWAAMIPLIRVLSVVGAIQSILALNGSIYISQGKAKIAFRVTLVANIVFIIGLAIGIRLGGLNGVAYAYFITSLFSSVPIFYMAAKLIDVSIWDATQKLGKIFTSSLIMSGSVYLIMAIPVINKLPVFISLIIGVISGAFIFLFLVWILNIEVYFELKSKLIGKLSRKRPV